MSLKILVLGSNSAVPFKNRFPSAQIVYCEHASYMIDCGEGAQIQMSNFGVKPLKINQIFITHLHGDHFFGLAGLINTMSLNGRKNPLGIYGPKELKSIIETQLAYGRSYLGFDLNFHVTDDSKLNLIYEDELIEVYSFPLIHKIPTTGFKFVEKPRELNIKAEYIQKYNLGLEQIKQLKQGESIKIGSLSLDASEACYSKHQAESYAYCSDTAFSEDTAKYVESVDILYHESTYLEDMKEEAANRCHSTAMQAAEVAKMAKASYLMLGHYSNRYLNLNQFLTESRVIFEKTVLSKEGDFYGIHEINEKLSAE